MYKTDVVEGLKALFSPKQRLGRKGFVIVFLFAMVSIQLLSEMASQLWLLYAPYPYWKFNFHLNMVYTLSVFSFIIGLLPLTALICVDITYCSFVWGYEVGYGFFCEALIADFLFIMYFIQCLRRNLDIGKSWIYSFSPFYNPFALLLRKGTIRSYIENQG